MDLYNCINCNYKTYNKQRYELHLKSNKHYNTIHNNPLYTCVVCNKTYKLKSSLERHKTKIHNENTLELQEHQEHQEHQEYICKCGKTYKHKSSFSRHKKECNYKTSENIILSNEQVQQLNNSFDFNKLIDIFQSLVDKVSNTTTINTITNNNNNNNKKQLIL
jgi:hypothetical protein